MTSAKVGLAVREREETRPAAMVGTTFVPAAVVDQRVVAVVAAEVLALSDPHRVSVSESMRMAGPCQLKPARTWRQPRQAQWSRGLLNVRSAIRGVSAATVANPGLTLALSAGQTGTGARRKLLDLI